jgi:hypothetical protein
MPFPGLDVMHSEASSVAGCDTCLDAVVWFVQRWISVHVLESQHD